MLSFSNEVDPFFSTTHIYFSNKQLHSRTRSLEAEFQKEVAITFKMEGQVVITFKMPSLIVAKDLAKLKFKMKCLRLL